MDMRNMDIFLRLGQSSKQFYAVPIQSVYNKIHSIGLSNIPG